MRRFQPYWLPGIAQALLAAVLCFVPLFNSLGYEFSLATGILAAITAPAIGLVAGSRAGSAPRAMASAVGIGFGHLLLPLLIITLNIFRVRNCNYLDGLGFFLLLPTATTLYGAAIGAAIARLFANRSRSIRWLVTSVAIVLPLVWSLWNLYWEPPIFAYDHLWGHFAGSLYDEAIALSSALVVFRTGTLLRIAGILLFLVASERRQALSPTRLFGVGAALVIAIAIFEIWIGGAYGFRVSRRHISRALPVQVEREGLVIHLPRNIDEKLREEIADDHAFRLAQLKDRLAVDSLPTIHSYIYANANQKARLMGGRATMIAKPWLHEIHIHNAVAPHPVLGHELAHVVSASFGTRLLGVSARYGVLVNLVLVEGLAEAVSPERSTLDLDGWARAMRALKIAPEIRTMFAPSGFWQQAPRRAYTIAGSFVRFLLDQHGAESFKRAYASGNFEAAYGQSLEQLASAWEAHLDSTELNPRETRIAEERFRRRSIFARLCAHEVAKLRQRANRATPAKAVEIYRQICEHVDNTPHSLLQLASALRRANELDQFLLLTEQLLADSRLNAIQRAGVIEDRGEIFWQRGDLEAAKASAKTVLDASTSLPSNRLQWVKLWALDQKPEVRETLQRFLFRKLDPLAAVIRLKEASVRQPDDRTMPYLIARQLARVRAWEESLRYLDEAAGHPFEPIEAERIRLTAEVNWKLRRIEQASAAYSKVAALSLTSGERVRAEDWLERLAWYAADRNRSAQD